MIPNRLLALMQRLTDKTLFGHTSKVGRQVLRFFKHRFLQLGSPGLYQSELTPEWH